MKEKETIRLFKKISDKLEAEALPIGHDQNGVVFIKKETSGHFTVLSTKITNEPEKVINQRVLAVEKMDEDLFFSRL